MQGARAWKQSRLEAFGDHGDAAWFVSEFYLPVPEAWRTEIPYTYRCPDFSCGAGDRVLIVELKTEQAGSHSARQMVDYLRLVRHKLGRFRDRCSTSCTPPTGRHAARGFRDSVTANSPGPISSR